MASTVAAEGRYLGVLAYRHVSRRPMWGESTGFIRSLISAGRSLDIPVYAFGPQDVAPSRREVRGWTYRRGRWQRRRLPPPPLVYDRFFLRRSSRARRRLQQYRRLKREKAFSWLSPGIPNKWIVHTVLARSGRLQPVLPPTVLYRRPSDIAAALGEYGGIVVKPVLGQKGQGIWFMTRGRSTVRARSSQGGSARLGRASLSRWARRRLNPGTHMIQPLLDLRDRAGRPRDIRVLVQRNGRGGVEVTGMGARIGRRNSFVANLHRGGRSAPVGSTFPVENIEETMGRLALEIFSRVETETGPLAEAGVDLAVDGQGAPWFIEINGTPGRSILRAAGSPSSRRRSIVNPLEYARWLMDEAGDGRAGKPPEGGGGAAAGGAEKEGPGGDGVPPAASSRG